MLCLWALLFICVMNRQDLVAADPVTDSQGTTERNAWCDDHNAIHKRLDNVQEQVEKTVDYLDSEVKSLLNDISETAWNVPLPPGTPLVDIFEEPN
ncbi:placenta-specific protein 9 [Tiliqua scincoides]|uniref:placenta-specific protein 9 n=1 Tax=Tiliqua scincoides TaxID=71010 RepID=UPI003462FDAC